MTVIINGKEKTVKADASKCELKDLLRDNTEYNQKRLIQQVEKERKMEIVKWANGKGNTIRVTKEEKKKLLKALQESSYLKTVTVKLDSGETEIDVE